MNESYQRILDRLPAQGFDQEKAWLAKVADAPGFEQWWGLLNLIGYLSLGVVFFVALGWGWERLWMALLDHQRPRGELALVPDDGAAAGRMRALGLAGKWMRILATRPQSDRSGAADAVGALVARRYDWAGAAFGLLRNAALIVGLLFTFIGLGLTLQQLSGALDLGDQNVTNVGEAVKGVRDALPGLSTAFGSSVFGVVLALFVWIADTAMQMLRNDIEAALKVQSVRWLEAHYRPPTTESNFTVLVTELRALNAHLVSVAKRDDAANHEFREALTGLTTASASLERSAGASSAAMASIEQTASGLSLVAVRLKDSFEEVTRALEAVVGGNQEVLKSHQVVAQTSKEVAAGVTAAAQEVDALLKAEGARLGNLEASILLQLERFDESVSALREATAGHGEQYGEILEAMQSQVGQLDTLTQAFVGTAELLDGNANDLAHNTATLANNLQVSGVHVASLAQAAKDFTQVQERTKEAVDKSIIEQNQLFVKVRETFESIPQMTEAITRVTVTSSQALENLTAALVGEDLQRYLQKLPELANLTAAEVASRHAFAAAAAEFAKVTHEIDNLSGNVRAVGANSMRLGEIVSEQNQQLGARVQALIDGVSQATQVGLAGPVQQVVQAAMAPQQASIDDLRHQVESLGQQTDRLNDALRAGVNELKQARDESRRWRNRPRGFWAFFKRSGRELD